MPLLSVVIPHRNRNERLKWCLWSIARSAQASGVSPDDYEVIVADGRSDEMPGCPGRTRILIVEHAMPGRSTPAGFMRVFSKPRLLNKGIEAAEGDVFTFLDADAIVAEHWMLGLRKFGERPSGERPTRLCYQVRYVPSEEWQLWESPLVLSPSQQARCRGWFARWHHLQRAHEAYGDPESNGWGGEPIFGNSQFSIHRDDLGDLRFNEDFSGAGFEDLWMIREIWRRHGDAYRGEIMTGPTCAMLHVKNDRHDWVPDMPDGTEEERKQRTFVLEEINRENRKRYLES